MDHLASFAHVPFDQLTTLEVSRAVPPSAAMPFHPHQREGDQPRQIPKVHDLCHSQPIPDDIYQAILDKGKGLTKLNLDWWEIDEERLTRLIKTLIGLEELTVRLNFPLFRLVSAIDETQIVKVLIFTSLSGHRHGFPFDLSSIIATHLVGPDRAALLGNGQYQSNGSNNQVGSP